MVLDFRGYRDDRYRDYGGPPFDPHDRDMRDRGPPMDRGAMDPRERGPPPDMEPRDPRMRIDMRGPPDQRGPPSDHRGPPDGRGPPDSRGPPGPRGAPRGILLRFRLSSYIADRLHHGLIFTAHTGLR